MPDLVSMSVSATRERVNVTVDTVREVVQVKVISDSYALPTASDTTLGGVKIGSGLTITAGVLSADSDLNGLTITATTGTLTIADGETLRVGSGITTSGPNGGIYTTSGGYITTGAGGYIETGAGGYIETGLNGFILTGGPINTLAGGSIQTGTGNLTGPNTSGIIALTSDITGTNSGTNTGDNAVNTTSNAYADALVVGLVDDRGNFNASVNTFPTTGGSGTAGAILKGDLWTISVVATSGPLNGYAVGCIIRALIDPPGQTVGNWAITAVGFGYTPVNSAGTLALGGFSSITGTIAIGNIGGLGTGVGTALAVNIGSAGAPVTFNGALGTPSSGTLTNCTFPTLNQSTTGSAATLTTARTIGGSNFDGSANVTSFPSPGNIGATTPGTGAFTTVTTPSIKPSADSTTAIRFYKADGTTVIGTWDTTNGRFGIGITPTTALHVSAASGTTARFIGNATGNTADTFYAQNANTAGQATFIFENNRGSYASYGGIVYGGQTQTTAGFLGSGGANARQDRMFIFADGASNLGLYVGTLTAQPLVFSTNNLERMQITGAGDIVFPKTITAAATTGAQTINKTSGRVNFAAAATSLVVTNSLCTANSIIHCTIATNDATANGLRVVAGAGSFTIYMLTAPTAETAVNFRLTN